MSLAGSFLDGFDPAKHTSGCRRPLGNLDDAQGKIFQPDYQKNFNI
jgi:hypothetical protein